MSHPGVGMDKWEDLPRAKPVYLGAGAISTFYAWLKLEYGFKDENIRPYNFNSAPFIANKNSIQQGYVTGEPFEIERQGHFMPNLFLLADYGYDTYATLIVTRTEIVKKKPDLVQRFVDASAIGWYHYLYGDNSKANALIKADNPDLTDDYIAFSIAEMKKHGIVNSGDALKLGIGAMADAHWKDFFEKMVAIGLIDKRTNYKSAYTLQFTNKKVAGRSPSSVIAWREIVHVAHSLLTFWPPFATIGLRPDMRPVALTERLMPRARSRPLRRRRPVRLAGRRRARTWK